MTDVERMRGLVGAKDQRGVAEMLTRVAEGFKRAGYHLVIRNEAWMRPGGIKAAEYINTPEGGRYRGGLIIHVQRGEARAEVHLTGGDPAKFEISWGAEQKEKVDKIDRTLLKILKERVDRRVEEAMQNTMRLLL